jgi:hypothetical protein
MDARRSFRPSARLALAGTASDYLEARQRRLADLLAELARDVDRIENVKVDKQGDLHLTALDAVVPDAVKHLQRRLERRIPLISLPDLLNEVNRWTGCFRHFTSRRDLDHVVQERRTIALSEPHVRTGPLAAVSLN